MSKLYYEMTAREKLEFNSRMVAGWVRNSKLPIMLPLIRRKRRNSDGWYYEWNYCVYDCESQWSPIDCQMFTRELGIGLDNFVSNNLSTYLRTLGYDARDVIGGIIILPKTKTSRRSKK